MATDWFRSLRNKITGLNGAMVRFDIMQNNLDNVSCALMDHISDKIGILQNKLDIIGVPKSIPEAPAESEMHQKDAPTDYYEDVEGFEIQPPLRDLQPNERLRIAFIVQHPSVWTSWRSVWFAASKDQRFHPKIVLTPFIHPYSSEALTLDDMKRLLINEKAPFCTAEYFDVNSFKPHVTFIQNPYEDTRPENLRIVQLKNAGTRIAYIPYGLEIGGGAWNMTVQFDSLLQRSAWRIFARSERHKTMFGKYCHAGNDHVYVSGHPKFDSINTHCCDKLTAELSKKISSRKVLLWTPHFSVGDPPTWSTYRLYGEFILSCMQHRQDLFLLIRPHPMLFQAMLKHKLWDKESENEFRRKIEESGNLALDESSDYHEAFSLSDALMADVGSFLLEYLPTGKPILYLHHPDGLGMNDDGKLLRYLYTCSGPKDISEFIEMVALGKDPRKAERQAVLPMFLFGLESNIGERICQHIYSSVSTGDCWSHNFTDQRKKKHVISEEYWRNSSCTYLAPKDYYERKEVILGDILARQPRFKNAIDIGCGDGRYTYLLAEYADEVTGYDISPALIEKAKSANCVESANLCGISFVVQEIEAITPLEKYDLVSCMGVTSCIFDDGMFLRILDKFRMLSKIDARLFLIDTLSSEQEQVLSDESGYIAKYRNIEDYLKLVQRRGFRLQESILIAEDEDKKQINKLFVFTFGNPYLP